MSITYDAGALVAAERGDLDVRTRHDEALDAGELPVVPAAVVWQVWRDSARQVRLAKMLRGCKIEPIDEATARSVGELLGRAGGTDGVDAAVVVSAARRGGVVYTSDPDDLRRLTDCLGPAAKRLLIRAV